MDSQKKPYEGTQTVLKAITLLQLFTDVRPEWNLPTLVKEIGFNRTTVFRLLTALESKNLVVRDPISENYRLGSGAIVLGGHALRSNPLRVVVRPALEALSRQTGETATLDVLDGHYTLLLDEVKGNYLMGMQSSVGTRWPVHASSTGHVLLAFLPVDTLAAHLSQPLLPITEYTIVDLGILQQRLAQIRRQGFATAMDDLEIGYSDISVPVFDHTGATIAAISIGGATPRLPQSKLVEIAQLLCETAVTVSHQLGFRT